MKRIINGKAYDTDTAELIARGDHDHELTQAQMTRFLLDLGPEFPRWVGDESKGLAKRLNRLIEIYDQQPDRSLDQGEAIADALVDKAVSLFVSEPSYPWQDPPEPPESERT